MPRTVQFAARTSAVTGRPRSARRGHHAARVPARIPERRSAGLAPQDTAHYVCECCGLPFTAAVSTTVGCPGCGGEQTW